MTGDMPGETQTDGGSAAGAATPTAGAGAPAAPSSLHEPSAAATAESDAGAAAAAQSADGETRVPAAPASTPWLGHLNGCSVQWSNVCDCDPDAPVEFTEEERPDDDPAPIPTCDGRYCGGRPHE